MEMAENEIATRLRFSKEFCILFLAHDAKRFQPFFLAFIISFALLSILHRRTKSLFKKYVKEDLTPFFKLNQLLNRACAQAYVLYLYFVFILPHR